jgi:hypothetical protein
MLYFGNAFSHPHGIAGEDAKEYPGRFGGLIASGHLL